LATLVILGAESKDKTLRIDGEKTPAKALSETLEVPGSKPKAKAPPKTRKPKLKAKATKARGSKLKPKAIRKAPCRPAAPKKIKKTSAVRSSAPEKIEEISGEARGTPPEKIEETSSGRSSAPEKTEEISDEARGTPPEKIEETSDEARMPELKTKATPKTRTRDLKRIEGTSVGLGIILGLQHTSADINREFRDRNASVDSFICGGSVAVGYQRRIGGKFTVGVEVGVDLGADSRRAPIGGGILRASSVCLQDEFTRRDILRQMMSESAEAMDTHAPIGAIYPNLVDANVWHNFASVMRHIGGGAVDISGDLLHFTTAAAHADGIFDTVPTANPSATLRNFMGRALTRAAALENRSTPGPEGGILSGLSAIREFTTRRYPAAAAALSHLADLNLQDPTVPTPADIPGTSLAGASNLNRQAVYALTSFLRNRLSLLHGLRDLGIDPADAGGYTVNDVEAAMTSIHSPTADDDAALAVPSNVTPLSRKPETGASFGVCPHVALKIGYFFDELKAHLYAKVGAMLLNGHAFSVDAFGDVRSENFHKTTPMIALGFEKNLTESCGISADIFHAFKTNKKLRDIAVLHRPMRNRVDVSRTGVRITAVFRF
jgi:hypothetical protein